MVESANASASASRKRTDALTQNAAEATSALSSSKGFIWRRDLPRAASGR